MKREHHFSSDIKNFAAKLAPKFSGSFIIANVLSLVVYDPKSSTGKRHHIHIKDLKQLLFSGVTEGGKSPCPCRSTGEEEEDEAD